MGNDIFNRTPSSIRRPITADKCLLTWDGQVVTQASNFSMTYNQGINRRRSIGNNDAVIYATLPVGQASMSRLLCLDKAVLFNTPSWTCVGGTITFKLDGDCSDSGSGAGAQTYTASGCIVTSYTISATADDLSVMDNVVIEFLELAEG